MRKLAQQWLETQLCSRESTCMPHKLQAPSQSPLQTRQATDTARHTPGPGLAAAAEKASRSTRAAVKLFIAASDLALRDVEPVDRGLLRQDLRRVKSQSRAQPSSARVYGVVATWVLEGTWAGLKSVKLRSFVPRRSREPEPECLSIEKRSSTR